MPSSIDSPSRRAHLLGAASVAIAAAALLAGCGSTTPSSPRSGSVRRVPSTTNALSWVGRYRAEASCPTATGGCTSQVLLLTLNPDRSYSLATTTNRRGGRPYTVTSRAHFRMDPDGRVITLASKDENTRLRLDGDTLVRIGRDGLNETAAAREPLVFRRL